MRVFYMCENICYIYLYQTSLGALMSDIELDLTNLR